MMRTRPLVPDECASFEEAQRLRHLDLAGKSALALWQEQSRVRFQLTRYKPKRDGDPALSWLIERLAAIRMAMTTRGIGGLGDAI